MTTKEFYENLGVLADEEMEQKRQTLIAGIDNANSAKKAKNAEKKAVEDKPIRDAILAVVTDELTVSADLTAKVNGVLNLEKALTVAKVVAVANDLAKAGEIAVEKVIVDKGVRNAYKKA